MLADIYVDRGRELGVFPSESRSSPVVSKADFDKLGALLLPKIVASVRDKSIEDAPFYWDFSRAWAHLGKQEDVIEWIAQGVMESGSFAAKIARGMVSQSMSDAGIRYEYRQRLEENLYDERLIYEAAKRHAETDTSLNDDERSLLRAVISGVEKRERDEVEPNEEVPPSKRQTPKRVLRSKPARRQD